MAAFLTMGLMVDLISGTDGGADQKILELGCNFVEGVEERQVPQADLDACCYPAPVNLADLHMAHCPRVDASEPAGSLR